MSRILLVDDDESMLALTGRWLEKDGYTVDKVASGEKALDFLKSSRPDLILLDYAMPGMDGPAVLSAIRSMDSLKGVPVLYRTGMENADEDLQANDIRPDGIVPKSQGRPYLLRAVKEALA